MNAHFSPKHIVHREGRHYADLLVSYRLIILPRLLFTRVCCVCVFPAVAMYREPSLHDVGETVPKAAAPPAKSTSEPAVMNGGKPVSKEASKPST